MKTATHPSLHKQVFDVSESELTLVLLNPYMNPAEPVFENSVDPDQLASEEIN